MSFETFTSKEREKCKFTPTLYYFWSQKLCVLLVSLRIKCHFKTSWNYWQLPDCWTGLWQVLPEWSCLDGILSLRDLSTIPLSLVLSEKGISCKRLCKCYLLIPECENVSTGQPMDLFNLHVVGHLFLCMFGPNQHFSWNGSYPGKE